MIRDECNYKKMNYRKERSCTVEDLCVNCMMDKDVEENRELYNAMGEV